MQWEQDKSEGEKNEKKILEKMLNNMLCFNTGDKFWQGFQYRLNSVIIKLMNIKQLCNNE